MHGCIDILIGIYILLGCGRSSSARARGSNGGSGLARPLFKSGKYIGGHRHLQRRFREVNGLWRQCPSMGWEK
ncbi:hypothetical protein BJV74DRAFT_820808 [Russula compacta]|nr:hypothetical protein BJV74DRAFT_820808 [Russula compacta]